MVERSIDMRNELHGAYSRMVSRLDVRKENRIALDAIVDNIENGDISQKRLGASSLNHFFSSCAIYVLASESLEGKLPGDKFYSLYSGIIESGSVYNAILEKYDDYDVYRMAKDNLAVWEKELSEEAELEGVLMHSRPEMNRVILEALRMANPFEYHRVFLFGRVYVETPENEDGSVQSVQRNDEENGIARALAGFTFLHDNSPGLGAFHRKVVGMACDYLRELSREEPYRAAELLLKLDGNGGSVHELAGGLQKKLSAIEAEAGELMDIFIRMSNGADAGAVAQSDSTPRAMGLMDSIIEAFGILDRAKAALASGNLRR